ncbi:MAG: hypothetical protein EPN60_17005 [Nevskiaceae bacterium]|nr:MAG: hypothetical protein EPN60_17005 [Nevskiaceae bacterium]
MKESAVIDGLSEYEQATMLRDFEQRDCVMRALNNVAIARNELLAGRTDEALRRLDAALTWSWPLLGVGHPSEGAVDHVSQPLLLNHEGGSHRGRDS